MERDWISVKEAAGVYGLSADYFRRNYCEPGGILERLKGLRIRRGPAGGKRILVSRATVLQLMQEETKGA